MDIIMNIRRAVLFIASILLCGLLFIYALFERDKEVHQTREEEKIKVRVLACYEIQQERELLKQLADDFNQKYQACMVEVEFIDKENLKKDICLRVDSGEQPDIVIPPKYGDTRISRYGSFGDWWDFLGERKPV